MKKSWKKIERFLRLVLFTRCKNSPTENLVFLSYFPQSHALQNTFHRISLCLFPIEGNQIGFLLIGCSATRVESLWKNSYQIHFLNGSERNHVFVSSCDIREKNSLFKIAAIQTKNSESPRTCSFFLHFLFPIHLSIHHIVCGGQVRMCW